jgi:2-polyprenyl-3-methyl-5-hydroxy-6-metoxy-1,4-benzoquinol methylase
MSEVGPRERPPLARQSRSASGDYVTPGTFRQRLTNLALSCSRFVPGFIGDRILASHTYYQELDENNRGAAQGPSALKWQAMGLPPDLGGRSVLDIGCAEGFFCRETARQGAGYVMGVDTRLSALICARLLARKDGLDVHHRVAVFPRLALGRQFDYVFCLSVLHHTVSTKDIWKVLSDPAHRTDLETLRGHLKALRQLTAPGGRCIIEMPYEYTDQDSKASVDFSRFEDVLLQAGFQKTENLGAWGHAAENREKKDRILYAAHAPGA